MSEELRIEAVFAASTERVFRAISTGEEVAQWFPDDECRMTPEVGGEVYMKWSGGHSLTTTFHTFVAGKELSYGFFAGEEEVVSFSVHPDADGCKLVLCQRILPGTPEAAVGSIRSEWLGALDALKTLVEA